MVPTRFTEGTSCKGCKGFVPAATKGHFASTRCRFASHSSNMNKVRHFSTSFATPSAHSQLVTARATAPLPWGNLSPGKLAGRAINKRLNLELLPPDVCIQNKLPGLVRQVCYPIVKMLVIIHLGWSSHISYVRFLVV